MTEIVIYKNEQGKLQGLGQAGERAYAKFKKWVAGLDYGETAKFIFEIPRSPKHHRKLFMKLRTLMARTESFPDIDDIRRWATIGAGYMVQEEGKWVAQSINYEAMDEVEFSEFHQRLDDFLVTDRALRFIWPHMQVQQRRDAMAQFFSDVERQREVH